MWGRAAEKPDFSGGSSFLRTEQESRSGAAGRVLSVSAFMRSVRDLLEHRIPPVWIGGEISNFTPARSGHWYFALKDGQAQVRCVMFRNRNQSLDWEPRDGAQVELRALATLYEPRGDFQLTVETLRPAGLGALYEQFLRLRDRLAAEGLFSEALKRPLPAHPRRVGIISSPDGAAVHDILSTLARRNPGIEAILYPSAVQGERAAAGLAAALAQAVRRREVDVLILARGGGSIEDLWGFNDEALARAIRSSPIPVVTGVGHETDFTIADFAADLRAPTPTAAAELVSPPLAGLVARAAALQAQLTRALRHRLERDMQRIDALGRRVVHPAERLAARAERLGTLAARLAGSLRRGLEDRGREQRELHRRLRHARPRPGERAASLAQAWSRLRAGALGRLARNAEHLAGLGRSLEHLHPDRVLERGYSLVLDAQGRLLTDAARVQTGDAVQVRLARGSLQARVENTRPAAD
jgi:exodeoxyribonuclease VII large subunit